MDEGLSNKRMHQSKRGVEGAHRSSGIINVRFAGDPPVRRTDEDAMILPARALLGRRLDDPEVRASLQALGDVVESTVDEEQELGHYVAVRSAGLELSVVDGVVQCVHLYAAGRDGYGQFEGPLPLRLSMGMSQSEVREWLGAPQFEREAMDDEFLGRLGPGDRYDYADFSVAFDYAEESRAISFVQMMVPSAVPGKG